MSNQIKTTNPTSLLMSSWPSLISGITIQSDTMLPHLAIVYSKFKYLILAPNMLLIFARRSATVPAFLNTKVLVRMQLPLVDIVQKTLFSILPKHILFCNIENAISTSLSQLAQKTYLLTQNCCLQFTKSSVGGLKCNDFERELGKGRKLSVETVVVQSTTHRPVGTHQL